MPGATIRVSTIENRLSTSDLMNPEKRQRLISHLQDPNHPEHRAAQRHLYELVGHMSIQLQDVCELMQLAYAGSKY